MKELHIEKQRRERVFNEEPVGMVVEIPIDFGFMYLIHHGN